MADLIFKDFSRKRSKFKYFSSLCEPCDGGGDDNDDGDNSGGDNDGGDDGGKDIDGGNDGGGDCDDDNGEGGGGSDFVLFVLLLYDPRQQLRSWRDSQFN